MKFSNKLSSVIFITGVVVLILLSFTTYKLNYNSTIKSQFIYTESIAREVSEDIDRFLDEKVKTALTIANMPIINEALVTSNLSYANLADEKRKESINHLNEKWKSTKDPTDNFILEYTDNKISRLLKKQQSILKGEYGEIFLSNKFGVLVASTSKLSTFAHGRKYWWLGSYNNGEGAVFFDDRGYDDSVDGYVLGLVVPIRKGMEIIGILKCNLNILGSISQLVSGAGNKLIGKFKLVRSGGMVVFEEGFEPLSTQIHSFILEKLESKDTESFIINDSGEKFLVGISEIEMTKGEKGYGFGGNFESIDHKKGNTGETWNVICYRQMNIALSPVTESIKSILLIGVSIILILVLFSFLFGHKISKPFAILDKATEKIGKRDFEYRIDMKRNDEFGKLAHSFNNMASELLQTTTSIELLKKSEEILSEFIKSATDGFILFDSELNYIEVNESALKIVGLDREDITDKNILDVVPNVKETGRYDKYINVIKTGVPLFFYDLIPHSKFGEKYLELKAFKMGDGLGIIFNDITHRKQTEEALHQYKHIVSSSTDMLALLDKRFTYLAANKAYINAFKLTPEQVIGCTVTEVFGKKIFNNVIKSYAGRCLGGEEIQYQDWFDFPAHGQRYMDINYYPYYGDGNEIIGFVVNGRNITEYKHWEDALRKSEEKYRQLFENSIVGIGVADKSGRIIEANNTIMKITGYSRDELSRMNLAESYVNQKDRDELLRFINQYGKVENFEIQLSNKQGKHYWANIAVQYSKYRNEEVFIISMIDITRRKQLEAQIKQTHKMEAIGTLAGGIAHDFNNILSPIFGYVEFAMDHINQPERITEYLKEILQGAERARTLVRQILTFSRQTKLEERFLQMSLVVKEAVKLMRSIIPSTIEIKQEITTQKTVRADSTHIHQLVMNLCTNAYHAMREIGGTLSIVLKDVELTDADLIPELQIPPGQYLRLEISDTGHGMDKEIISKLFEPYFTSKKIGEGTGLGLAVVHGIVENHNGFIKVYSEPGQGTTFHVYFPVVDEKADVSLQNKEIKSSIGGKERIMVVDDEEKILKMVSVILTDYGYGVTAFESAVQALHDFEEKPKQYDLVITDMTMPDMTGRQLAQKILETRPDMPIILSTGHSELINRETALAMGAREYIEKPLLMSKLIKTMRGVLDHEKSHAL